MSSATSIDKRGFRLKPEATNKPEATKKPDATKKLEPTKLRHGKKPESTEPEGDAPADDGFRPWHFFVLASLMLATVAVVMSREATPEHLVLISFTIAATGAAAAGFYRMLAPLAADDASIFSEPLSERSRHATEREKALVMRSIKELEFDRAMGKLSPRDFDEMAGRLRARAIMLMKQLDDGGLAYREIVERELAARLSRSFRLQPEGSTLQPEGSTLQPEESTLQPEAAAPMAVAAEPGTCLSCRTANDADASFCKRCGAKLHEVQS